MVVRVGVLDLGSEEIQVKSLPGVGDGRGVEQGSVAAGAVAAGQAYQVLGG